MRRRKNIHFLTSAMKINLSPEIFSAKKTPHAFVIWKEKSDWVIEYSGSLDDNGAETSKITHAYISEAIDNLLVGKKVTIPATNSIGCEIHYRF